MKKIAEEYLSDNGYGSGTNYTTSLVAELLKDFAAQEVAEATKWISVDRSILKQAIDKWGVDAQCEMIEEECLELALAIQKFKRIVGDKDQKYANIIDEIADVTIMITQAHQIFPIERIQERTDFKMKRLTERLKDELYDKQPLPEPPTP